MRPLFILLLAVGLVSTAIASNHAELVELARQDQAVRMGEDDPSSDDARRQRVIELLARGEVRTPRDRLHAALVLQHTGLFECAGELRSTSPENYLLAHHLARAAFDAGEADAGHLGAATIDRYLGFTQGIQRYGTNRIIDQDSGEELLIPIDRSVSDEERARYGVPPLAELLERFRERGAASAQPAQ